MTPRYELAQVNVARLLAPLDSPQLADFVAALAPVNAAADAADGFVRRLVGESTDGTGATDATDVPVFGDSWMIVNLSVWLDPDALAAYMYDGPHRAVLARRREWFHRPAEAATALWWVPAGYRPSVAEAEDRLLRLRTDGPTPYAFSLRHLFPAPDGTPATAPLAACPAE